MYQMLKNFQQGKIAEIAQNIICRKISIKKSITENNPEATSRRFGRKPVLQIKNFLVAKSIEEDHATALNGKKRHILAKSKLIQPNYGNSVLFSFFTSTDTNRKHYSKQLRQKMERKKTLRIKEKLSQFLSF